MPERQDSSLHEKFQRKIGTSFRGVLVLLAVGTAACRGDGDNNEDRVTSTPFRARVERTISPSPSPTEVAIETPIPTPKTTPKPLLTFPPATATIRLTPIPTPVPTPVPTPRPTPTPGPTFAPLEICNTGRFIRPVDGQEIPTAVDVRVELAHDDNWDDGCTFTRDTPFDPEVSLIDRFGNRFDWDLYCLNVTPFNYDDVSACWRNGVILADFPESQWGMEIKINENVVSHINVVIK